MAVLRLSKLCSRICIFHIMFSHQPRTLRPYHASHSSGQSKEKHADPEAIPHGHLSGGSLKATRGAYPLGGGQSEFDDTASECSIMPSDSVSNVGSRKKEPRESWNFEEQYRMRRRDQPSSRRDHISRAIGLRPRRKSAVTTVSHMFLNVVMILTRARVGPDRTIPSASPYADPMWTIRARKLSRRTVTSQPGSRNHSEDLYTTMDEAR